MSPWYADGQYYASEADAAKVRKIAEERDADRAAMLARVAARKALAAHVRHMELVQPSIRSLDAWGMLVRARLELEALVEDGERSRRLPAPPSRRDIEDAAEQGRARK